MVHHRQQQLFILSWKTSLANIAVVPCLVKLSSLIVNWIYSNSHLDQPIDCWPHFYLSADRDERWTAPPRIKPGTLLARQWICLTYTHTHTQTHVYTCVCVYSIWNVTNLFFTVLDILTVRLLISSFLKSPWIFLT